MVMGDGCRSQQVCSRGMCSVGNLSQNGTMELCTCSYLILCIAVHAETLGPWVTKQVHSLIQVNAASKEWWLESTEYGIQSVHSVIASSLQMTEYM